MTNLTLLQIEQKIVGVIAVAVPEAKTSTSPEVPKEWDRAGSQGAILVRYVKDPPSEQRESFQPKRPRSLTFQVFIGAKSLRPKKDASASVYGLLERARHAATKAKLIDDYDAPLYLIDDGAAFFSEINGVWWFVLTLTTNPYQVEPMT
jgi:Gp37 protein